MKKISCFAGLLVLVVLLIVCLSATAYAESGVKAFEPSEVNVDARQWKDVFPNEYYTFRDSVYYEYPVSATGHAGSLWDMQHVGNWSAGCGVCHSSQYVSLVEELGDTYLNVNTVSPGRYARAKISDEALEALDDEAFNRFDARRINDIGITCASCHGDTPGQLVVFNPWTVEGAEKAGFDLDNPDLVCAQCHSVPDYTHILTDTDTSTWFMLQYGTDPDAVYDGFLAHGVPNPEFSDEGLEFDQFYGSKMDRAGANCYDCHTRKVTDSEGNQYTDHAFLDPGVHQELYENCASCHKDSAEERYQAVLVVQENYRQRAENALEQVEALKAAVEEAGENVDAAILEQATALYYRAQFYYDYGRETAEGVHSIGNGTTETCFEKAVATAEEGLKLFA